MAFVPTDPALDPNAPPAGQPAPNAPMNLPPAPATSSGAPGTGGAIAGGSGQGVSATPNAGVQPPVQNLQDYLAANQPQAVAMGNTIANNLTAKAGQVTGDIGADLAAVDARVQASNTAPNPDLVGRAAANPANFVTNPKDLADFLAQENANYSGPTSIEQTPEWAALTREVGDATRNAPDVTKPGGFLELAAGQETNPTPGMTNLDAALLQETPEAAAPIIAAAKPYAALPGQQSTAATAEDAAIQAAQANDAAAAGLISPAFLTGPNAEVPAWEAALMANLTGAQGAENTYNTAVGNTVSGATTQQKALQAAKDADFNKVRQGVVNTGTAATDAAEQAKVLGYIDPTTYFNELQPFLGLSPTTAAPTEANTATAGDYATEAALQQLLGGKFTPPITPATASQAGTFSVPALPGAVPDVSGEEQYMNDIASMFTSNMAPFTQAAWQTETPQQIAQFLLNQGQIPGQGVTTDPATIAYLNRIVANAYAR